MLARALNDAGFGLNLSELINDNNLIYLSIFRDPHVQLSLVAADTVLRINEVRVEQQNEVTMGEGEDKDHPALVDRDMDVEVMFVRNGWPVSVIV